MAKKWEKRRRLLSLRYMMIFRELRTRNEIYRKDCQTLLAHQDSEDFEDLFEAHKQKWEDIEIPMDDDLLIEALGWEEDSFSISNEEPHHLTLRIDLRFPIKRIMAQLERWIYDCQNWYYQDEFKKSFISSQSGGDCRNDWAEEVQKPFILWSDGLKKEFKKSFLNFLKKKNYPSHWFNEIISKNPHEVWPEELQMEFEMFKRKSKRKELPQHYSKKLKDPDYYERCLEVWDLREKEKKSWSQIVDRLKQYHDHKTASISTARNYHRVACRLIKEGLPGYLPFPTK
jgi:hypothetical protein